MVFEIASLLRLDVRETSDSQYQNYFMTLIDMCTFMHYLSCIMLSCTLISLINVGLQITVA